MFVCVSGKTELLYHLLCRCVLPVAAGGLEVDVVFVDTDYSLDMLRLVSILDSRLNAGTHTHAVASEGGSGSGDNPIGNLSVVNTPACQPKLRAFRTQSQQDVSRPNGNVKETQLT